MRLRGPLGVEVLGPSTWFEDRELDPMRAGAVLEAGFAFPRLIAGLPPSLS
jgi:hypothetical protein